MKQMLLGKCKCIQMAETADSDYRLVEKSEIPDDEKDMPALGKAFRILSDCDIYEKK